MVDNEMATLHDLTGIFIEDGGKDFLSILVAREGAVVGCVSANIKTSQNFFSGDFTEGCFSSSIVGWGGFFIGFYVRRSRSLCLSNILAVYVQGGYAWRSMWQCRFRDEWCRGLERLKLWGPLWQGYS